MASTTVAQRYEIRSLLGKGSYGEVHLAYDKRLGHDVALKLLTPDHNKDRWQTRAEVAALRRLKIPGVVHLLDEGFDSERCQPYIAMDLIEGTPFPSTATGWEGLEPLFVALLTTLGHVHAAGVVHRDLKPQNILVDKASQPFILDFGLARSPMLGSEDLSSAGTPWYMAPEQITGAFAATAQSDLYSLGIIVVEAFSGRLLHRRGVQSFRDFAVLRSNALLEGEDALPEGLPDPVVAVLKAMLARDPMDRPRSALDLMAALRGNSPIVLRKALPFLGREDTLDMLESAALAGHPKTITGPRGIGRSRLLQELQSRLEILGLTCPIIAPGEGRFASFEALLGTTSAFEGCADGDAFLREAVRRLSERVDVLLIDDVHRLDWISRQTVDACATTVCTIQTQPTSGAPAIALSPLTEAQLRPLFGGSERIHHLPSDAARALWMRTGGLPARIEAEIASWLEVGLARWQGHALRVDRKSLRALDSANRLRSGLSNPTDPRTLSEALSTALGWVTAAWPNTEPERLTKASGLPRFVMELDTRELVRLGWLRQLDDGRLEPTTSALNPCRWARHKLESAHLDVAMCLAPGTEGRLSHLIAARSPAEDATEEALALAKQRDGQGRVDEAIEALIDGLTYARQRGQGSAEQRLLEELSCLSMALANEEALDRARYELERAIDSDDPHISKLLELLQAAQTARRDSRRALAALDAIAPFDTPQLEIWRHVARFRAAQRAEATRTRHILDEIEAWGQTQDWPPLRAIILGLRGLVLYRAGDYQASALAHSESAELRERPSARVSSLLNASSAYLEAGQLELALAQAHEARFEAEVCRHALYEARAERLLRSALYRLGRAKTPEMGLVEAISTLQSPGLEGQILLCEAAVAWRTDQRSLGHTLATNAKRIWLSMERFWPAMLSEALALACQDAPDPDAVADLATRAMRQPAMPRARIQTLGLLGAFSEPVPIWLDTVMSDARTFSKTLWPLRNEVLSIEESIAFLQPTRSP